jgi:predicted transcriptional regulator
MVIKWCDLMVKSLPEWLKKNYNTLWGKYQNSEFTLEDVSKLLDISRSMASKTLWQLENKGFILKTRSKIDSRNKIYRLISPDDIKYIIGLYSLIEKDEYKKYTLEDKLILINDEMNYAITGSQAAYYYHKYINPPKLYEIKIDPLDEGKWIAFLTDGHTRVYIDEVIPTKAAQNYVKLIHSIYEIRNIRIKSGLGFYIEKLEYLLIELLNRETQTSIKEIVAIIIRNKNIINWFGEKGLIQLALETNNVKKLGFIIDAINYELESELIDQKIVKALKDHISKRTPILVYPRDNVLLNRYKELRDMLTHKSIISKNEIIKYSKNISRYEEYFDLGEKWRILPIIPRNTIRKVLIDLGEQYDR